MFQRETGGGVVYHDQGNLNWSFLARADGPFHSPVKIFREASDYVVEAIGRLGIRANFFPPNRIDVSGRKVSGMAAKSTARALLVHGTLLLHSDLDKLNKLCVPPPGCPPVANLSEWSKRIDSTAVAAKLTEVLRDSGFDVKTR